MRLSDIYATIREELSRAEAEMHRQVRTIGGGLPLGEDLARHLGKVVGHLFQSSGKMLRPALVILASRLFQPLAETVRQDVLSLAVAVELFHSASLAHDDIIDNEEFRRNRLSLNRTYGNHIAVLVGDILYSRFFAMLTGLRAAAPAVRLELFSLFCRLTEKMCIAEIGEQRLLATEGGADTGEYLLILQYKTADLMAACCEGAAILCGVGDGERAALAGFGLSFGMAFQLFDDLRDGDSIGRSLADIREKAREYIGQAEGHLAFLPDGETRRMFSGLCAYVAEEEFSRA